jgi:hypothetical protein
MSQGPITTGNVPAALKKPTITKPVFTKPAPPTPAAPNAGKASGKYHGQK